MKLLLSLLLIPALINCSEKPSMVKRLLYRMHKKESEIMARMSCHRTGCPNKGRSLELYSDNIMFVVCKKHLKELEKNIKDN